MIYLLCAIFLIPLWGVSYLLLNRLLGRQAATEGQEPQASRLQRYILWLTTSLDQMFMQVPERTVKRVLATIVILAGLVGFFLPSTVPGVDRMAVERAMELNRHGEYDQALAILRDYENEKSPLIQNEIGVAQLGRRNYDEAANAFRRALGIEPNYGKAHANLATAYRHLDNFERMSFQLTRAKEMDKYPLDPDTLWGLKQDFTQGLLLRLLVALACMAVGYMLPRWIVNALKARRMKKYEEQLPDALIMAANGLRAGFSLVQALEVVAEETAPPLSQEFRLLLREHQLGADLDEALEHLALRVPNVDTRIFVNSLLILRETGGNLTEIFDTLAETIKERKRVLQKIKTMTAEGTTQAYILAVLPVVLGFIMYKLNPEVVGLLFTTSLGWLLLLLMALMEGVGLFWMLRMVKVRI